MKLVRVYSGVNEMAFVMPLRVISLSLAINIHAFILHDLGFTNIIKQMVLDARGCNGNFFSR